MPPIYFTVGPSQTHKNFCKHVQNALKNCIPSISHRSETFHSIYKDVDTRLKELWSIPSDYKILFFSSATEIWDRLTQNCLEGESLHFVTGAFGKKHANTNLAYQKKAKIICKEFIDKKLVSETLGSRRKPYEYIAFTHNESSVGVKTPESVIHFAKKISPTSLVLVDAVSSAPIPVFDFKLLDGVYFSVQKCFGLPAGLGVLIASPTLIEKSIKVKKKTGVNGYHKSFDTMLKAYEKWETVETPNVLHIYLLSLVLKDFQKIGIENIRMTIKENAKKIYEFFDKSDYLKPFVSKKAYRSETVIVIQGEMDRIKKIKNLLKNSGFVVGSGYGEHKVDQIRIACFPAQLPHISKLLSSKAWSM